MDVGAEPADQHVGAVVAVRAVVSRAALDSVRPGVARQPVVAAKQLHAEAEEARRREREAAGGKLKRPDDDRDE